jgi:DNA-binding CsgD family transcriptional regulator
VRGTVLHGSAEAAARGPGTRPASSLRAANGATASDAVGDHGGSAAEDLARDAVAKEELAAGPLASFSLGHRHCEVVPNGVAPEGRETLGRLALDGRTYLVVAARPEAQEPDLTSLLSPRELEIVLLVASGWDAKAVGRRLDISFHTVRVHTRRIYAKLQIHKQSELVALVAGQWSLQRLTRTAG